MFFTTEEFFIPAYEKGFTGKLQLFSKKVWPVLAKTINGCIFALRF